MRKAYLVFVFFTAPCVTAKLCAGYQSVIQQQRDAVAGTAKVAATRVAVRTETAFARVTITATRTPAGTVTATFSQTVTASPTVTPVRG